MCIYWLFEGLRTTDGSNYSPVVLTRGVVTVMSDDAYTGSLFMFMLVLFSSNRLCVHRKFEIRVRHARNILTWLRFSNIWKEDMESLSTACQSSNHSSPTVLKISVLLSMNPNPGGSFYPIIKFVNLLNMDHSWRRDFPKAFVTQSFDFWQTCIIQVIKIIWILVSDSINDVIIPQTFIIFPSFPASNFDNKIFKQFQIRVDFKLW